MTPPIRMVSVPLDVATEAVNCMARAYERVHSLPRVSDTELANRVGVAKEALRIVLAAAPVREEGGAVDREIARMRAVARDWRRPSLAQVEGPNDLKIYGGTIADDIDRWADMMAALATREEAPAEAGEDFRAQVVKLLDELIAHIVAIGPDKPDLNTPMLRRVWREVFADLIDALRAQAQAREGECQ